MLYAGQAMKAAKSSTTSEGANTTSYMRADGGIRNAHAAAAAAAAAEDERLEAARDQVLRVRASYMCASIHVCEHACVHSHAVPFASMQA